jgi:hypothetical protein
MRRERYSLQSRRDVAGAYSLLFVVALSPCGWPAKGRSVAPRTQGQVSRVSVPLSRTRP